MSRRFSTSFVCMIDLLISGVPRPFHPMKEVVFRPFVRNASMPAVANNVVCLAQPSVPSNGNTESSLLDHEPMSTFRGSFFSTPSFAQCRERSCRRRVGKTESAALRLGVILISRKVNVATVGTHTRPCLWDACLSLWLAVDSRMSQNLTAVR